MAIGLTGCRVVSTCPESSGYAPPDCPGSIFQVASNPLVSEVCDLPDPVTALFGSEMTDAWLKQNSADRCRQLIACPIDSGTFGEVITVSRGPDCSRSGETADRTPGNVSAK